MRNLKCSALGLGVMALLVATGLATGQPQSGQPTADPELQKLVDAYAAAWSKGDAAALAALYTTDAVYIDSGTVLMKGRAEIESTFKQRFAGELKGTTIAISAGQTRQVAPNVRVSEGAWQISGLAPAADTATAQPRATAATPTAGRYLNTYVREQGRWMIAGTAAVPEPPKAP